MVNSLFIFCWCLTDMWCCHLIWSNWFLKLIFYRRLNGGISAYSNHLVGFITCFINQVFVFILYYSSLSQMVFLVYVVMLCCQRWRAEKTPPVSLQHRCKDKIAVNKQHVWMYQICFIEILVVQMKCKWWTDKIKSFLIQRQYFYTLLMQYCLKQDKKNYTLFHLSYRFNKYCTYK